MTSSAVPRNRSLVRKMTDEAQVSSMRVVEERSGVTYDMSVTLETSQPPMSWLNAEA